MGLKCAFCEGAIGRYDDYLECSGVCKIRVHIACAGVSEAQLMELKKSGNIKRWKCKNCEIPEPERVSSGAVPKSTGISGCSMAADTCKRASSFDTELSPCGRCRTLVNYFSEVIEKLERKMASDMMTFKNQLIEEFESMLSARVPSLGPMEGAGSAASSDGPAVNKKSFAEAVSDVCSFVVKPVKGSQSVTATKNDLFHRLNPAENKIGLARVKGMKNGGIVVNCADAAESNRFRTMASDKLASDYTVKEVASLLPRIKLVGLSEEFGEDEFLNCLKIQNKGVVMADSICKFVNCKALRNRGDVYQAIVQVDKNTYQRALAAGHLFVGYDSCMVYDAIEVKRCYNCSGLNHLSKGCRHSLVCPKCAGNHSIKDCQSSELKCVNCVKYVEKIGGADDVNHAAWDSNCPCYTRMLSSIRSDILGVK